MDTVPLSVFWPADLRSHSHAGVLVGWRNSHTHIFVVTVLPESVNLASLIANGRNSCQHSFAQIYELGGDNPLDILGFLNCPPQKSLLHATIHPASPYPRFNHPHPVQVVIYYRPNPHKMQYISLKPISLNLVHHTTLPHSSHNLALKLLLHIKDIPPQASGLHTSLNQINCAHELQTFFDREYNTFTRRRRARSVSERVRESANDTFKSLLSFILSLSAKILLFLAPLVLWVSLYAFMAQRLFAEICLLLVETGSPALKDILASAQQIDMRLQQTCYWPIQYITLQKRKRNWASITTNHSDYIRFYNSLWLVANDIIIGIALGTYLIDNGLQLALLLDRYSRRYAIESLYRTILWLMDWPAGLKLNNELAAFLGDLFIWLIEIWSTALRLIQPYFQLIITIIGASGFLGASMSISLCSDLLSILTVHIYAFNIAASRIFHWQLHILISLFHLFRGKKKNVLRNRIDSCDYELDQLILGTILFTLLVFLFPTVFVFYATFASARLFIIIAKAILETILACLNYFPLFALMLRVKDPHRLPGGVCFDLITETGEPDSKTPTSYIIIKSIPLSLNIIFYQYFQLAARLREHYLSFKMLQGLLSGEGVPLLDRSKLYSFSYSMLPAQRIGISALYKMLCEHQQIN